jgi:hypothetical protein
MNAEGEGMAAAGKSKGRLMKIKPLAVLREVHATPQAAVQ